MGPAVHFFSSLRGRYPLPTHPEACLFLPSVCSPLQWRIFINGHGLFPRLAHSTCKESSLGYGERYGHEDNNTTGALSPWTVEG